MPAATTIPSPASTSLTVDHPITHYTALPGSPCKELIYRALRAGELLGVRVGHTWRIAPADFADWMDSRRVPSRDPLTDDLRAWAREQAAGLPPLTPVTARALGAALLEVQRDVA